MDITIGLPMYQGAGGLTISSLLSLQAALLERGDTVDFDIEMGGSIITKVRNRIVRRFLESGNDYLVFIDADMVFDCKDILTLIDSDADVCALNYRYRKPELKWANRPMLDDDGEVEAVKVNGKVWINTEAAGTGLMAIHRRALVRMVEACSDFVYEDNGQTVAIFDFELSDGHYYGEDYLFCKRWKAIGGDIWTLADTTTGHVGETAYTGNYHDYLGGVKNGTS
jgi:hypothetical protein